MSGDRQGAACPRGGARAPRTTTLRLTRGEASLFAAQCRTGGFGAALGRLGAGLDPAEGELALTDAEIGRLVRHCTYGTGPHPGLLRKVFARALGELLVG